MHARILVKSLAVATAVSMSTGCVTLFSGQKSGLFEFPYRVSPNDNTVILVAESASASIKGRLEEERVTFHWRPSEIMGSSPLSMPADLLAEKAGNRPVTNVRAKSDKVWYYSGPKGFIVWIAGALTAQAFFSSQTAASGAALNKAVTSLDFAGMASALGSAAGTAVWALPASYLVWHYSEQLYDWAVPDLYSTKVWGDYVAAPANLGQGGAKTPTVTAPTETQPTSGNPMNMSK